MSNTFYVIPKDSDLTHYGVLGMKWGVRRYQNADGSLTAAGQRRYQGKETANARRVRSFTRSAVGSLFGGGLGSLIGIASAHADNQQKINQRNLENDMAAIQGARIKDKPNQKYMTAESTIARNLYKNVNPNATPEQIKEALSKSYKEAQKRKDIKTVFELATMIGIIAGGAALEIATINQESNRLRQERERTIKQANQYTERRIVNFEEFIDKIKDVNIQASAEEAERQASKFSEIEIDDLLKNWKQDNGDD